MSFCVTLSSRNVKAKGPGILRLGIPIAQDDGEISPSSPGRAKLSPLVRSGTTLASCRQAAPMTEAGATHVFGVGFGR